MNMAVDGIDWAQLSSGIVGAILSAIVLIVISLVVAWITIWHQARATEKQLALQRLLSGRALAQQQSEFSGAMQVQRSALHEQFKEQRQALEKELTAQQEALDVQLHEQRRESALAREVAIRSELLELTSSFGITLGENRPDEILETDRQIAVKLHQWMINLSEPQDSLLRGELSNWGGLLSSMEVAASRSLPDPNGYFALGQALKAVQSVATNYRLTWSSVIWSADYCTRLLSSARHELEGFLRERGQEQGELDMWAEAQCRKEAKRTETNPKAQSEPQNEQ